MFRSVTDTQIHRALISRSVLRLNIRTLCSICIDLPDNDLFGLHHGVTTVQLLVKGNDQCNENLKF